MLPAPDPLLFAKIDPIVRLPAVEDCPLKVLRFPVTPIIYSNAILKKYFIFLFL
jgi:hypothetical protein